MVLTLKELKAKYGGSLREKLFDPKFFINEVIGFDYPDAFLTAYQEEWLKLLFEKKRLNLMAFRSSGKSELFFIQYPIFKAFTQPGWQGVLASSSLKQSVSLLRRIREKIMRNELLKTAIPQGREASWTKTEIQLKNGSIIWSKPNSENLAGEHVDYVGGDEIGYWKNMDIITKVIPPMTRAKSGIVAYIGTPTSEFDPIHELKKNRAYISRDYPADMMWKNGRTLWELRYPNIPMEDAKMEYDSLSWSREFLCKPLSTKDKIYPYELIKQCFDNDAKFTKDKNDHSSYFLGIDFALSAEAGSDFTVYTVLEKRADICRLIWMERHRGMSYEAQKHRIFELNENFHATKVMVDEGNFGKAFLQDLISNHVNAEGFRFTNESKQNLHTNLRNMFEKKFLIINRDESDYQTKHVTDLLIRELDKFGVIIEKGTVKLQGLGEHDDLVTSLALACWAGRNATGISWKVGRASNSGPTSGIKFMGRVN